ncbi:site-specific integrase [Lutibacter sp. A80]|uniref:tyrosine-type recombinase/integrase n=1 Tax=Lutibacter sp. A80 TaxID=2918453 RepID=UPI001F066B3F|nr:tyrosine-type recombinase/integrase [Lutibacter sp. A80]UMB60264.1 site-specific integrase [Lutibacter sp. A80]
MATIKFLLQSKSKNAPIYLRLSISRGNIFYRKTGLHINPKEWGEKGFPKNNNKSREIKDLTTKLKNLDAKILENFNTDNSKGITIDGDWLQNKIDIHFKRISETTQSELVTDAIQNIIDTAHNRDNGKGGRGLSQCRINAYNRLLELFIMFQGKKKYKVKELNKKVFDDFKNWLFDKQNYSDTYAFKKLSDLKGVCKDARANGIETSVELTGIKTKQLSAYDDDMDVIFLTPKEIEKIEKATLLKDAHINARKWLILACFTGQRGGDLIKLTESNFKKTKNKECIELTQQKTNTKVEIPILPKVREILKSGLPYKVSTQKLNKYFKEIGAKARINTPTMGRIIEASENPKEKKKRGVKKLRPKYTYISTHIGRRTFASNHYGKLPTPIIMKVTGHKKESTFLTYVNKGDDSHIDAFLEYYKKEEQKKKKETNLTVVKNASNQ